MMSCPECMSWSFEVSEVCLEAPRAESGAYRSAMEAFAGSVSVDTTVLSMFNALPQMLGVAL